MPVPEPDGPDLDPNTRAPSTPLAGAVKQFVRIAVGVVAAWLATRVDPDTAAQLTGVVELAVFTLVNVALAWAGKKLRDAGNPLGSLF